MATDGQIQLFLRLLNEAAPADGDMRAGESKWEADGVTRHTIAIDGWVTYTDFARIIEQVTEAAMPDSLYGDDI